MALPFRFLAGGPFAGGRQWFPWIHLADEVGAIRFLIEHPLPPTARSISPPPSR